MNYWNLNYWNSGEYQVVQEHYDDFRKKNVMINPVRKDVFRALKEIPYDKVRVAIFGQDPYPNPAHSTGTAFSIPDRVQRGDYPPTLVNILKEYKDDLHYPEPQNGSLSTWSDRGVLLWNVIPSCTAYHSLSHDWPEWEELNKEIVEKLNAKPDVLFAFLGGIARRYLHLVDPNRAFSFSHPSPRANLSSKTPFLGSRIFSKINSRLKDPIDWRLP